jgi:hypothetical protein
MSAPQTPPPFSPDEVRALRAALDEIIPPAADGRLPGAGELGLVAHFERAVGRRPELGPLLAQGLAGLDDLARGRGAESFAALPGDERQEVLDELGSRAPAFLPTAVALTYIGYYENPRVLEAHGFDARPPYPEGYEVPPSDPAVLDPVRRRAPMYREP